MLNFNISGNEELMKLRKDRAELLVALRELMYKDAELMEANGLDALGNNGCDYCDGSEDFGDGHSGLCAFANAVEILFQHRANDLEGIKKETSDLRWALVDLASADYLMMDEKGPCTHCDSDGHTADCPLHNALLLELKRVTTKV